MPPRLEKGRYPEPYQRLTFLTLAAGGRRLSSRSWRRMLLTYLIAATGEVFPRDAARHRHARRQR